MTMCLRTFRFIKCVLFASALPMSCGVSSQRWSTITGVKGKRTVITTHNTSKPLLEIFAWVVFLVLTANPVCPLLARKLPHSAPSAASSPSTYKQFELLRISVSTSSRSLLSASQSSASDSWSLDSGSEASRSFASNPGSASASAVSDSA